MRGLGDKAKAVKGMYVLHVRKEVFTHTHAELLLETASFRHARFRLSRRTIHPKEESVQY